MGVLGAPAAGGSPGGDSSQGSFTPGAPDSSPTTTGPAEGAPPTGTQPTEAPADAAPEAAEGTQPTPERPGPGWVPWAEHRQLKSEIARMRRESAQASQRYESEMTSLRQARESAAADLRRKAEDYDVLQAALQEHSDLADQLYDRLGVSSEKRPARGVEIPPEIAERLAKLDRIDAAISQVERREQETQKQMRLQNTERELDAGITKILADRRYRAPDRLLPLCKDYVLERVREMEGGTMEDVPHLLAEYLLPWEQEFQARLEGYRQGKTEDLRLPASAGGGQQTPLSQKTAAGANDDQTSRIAEELLSQRMGWGNGAP